MTTHRLIMYSLVVLFFSASIMAVSWPSSVAIAADVQEQSELQSPASQENATALPEFPEKLETKSDYAIAQVIEVIKEETSEASTGSTLYQDVKIRIISGPASGSEQEINRYVASGNRQLKKNDKVVLVHQTNNLNDSQYYIVEKYRNPRSIILALCFFALVFLLARWKGASSVLGLIASVLILTKFIVPNILAGHNPLMVSLSGALLIAFISLYLAHGFNRRTSVALLATLITLCIAVALSVGAVAFTHLTGTGTEESFYLQLAPNGTIDLYGLLLGGIIIGVLGVLDDITTGQVAAIGEIHRANPKLPFWRLYRSGLAVGQEHIASLVNTLVLAYAGASFPLFLLFALNGSSQPLWVTINSELITEEIVRTLVGSIALVLAVPIATFLGAYFTIRFPDSFPAEPGAELHSHSHK